MPPPYRADEIASALIDVGLSTGPPLHRFTVLADEEAEVWLIQGCGPSGEEQRLTFPFASARGIYTPAEIAGHFARGNWPFG